MKTTITTIIVFILIILGLYFLYTSESINNYLNKTTDESIDNNTEEVVELELYGVFSPFIKKDLSPDEKATLVSVLEMRDEKIKEAKSILENEFESDNSDMMMAFEKVKEIRENIKQSLIPFIDLEEMPSFDEKYMELGAELESNYILK